MKLESGTEKGVAATLGTVFSWFLGFFVIFFVSGGCSKFALPKFFLN